MRNTGQWILLTTIGLAGGLLVGLLIGMPLGKIVGAMLITAITTCLVGAVMGSMQAVCLRRLLARPIWWIVATTIGTGVGLALGVVALEQTVILVTGQRPNVAQLSSPARAVSFVVLGFVAGLALGIAQSLVFRIRYWIPTSAFALTMAFALSSLLVDASGLRIASVAGLTIFVIASGLSFGTFTSWPLRSIFR
jgi:hypothetical protein